MFQATSVGIYTTKRCNFLDQNESEEVRYKDTYKVNADAEFIYIF